MAMEIGNDIDIRGELLLSLAKESENMLNSLEERINKILDNKKLSIGLDKNVSDNLTALSNAIEALSSKELSGISRDLNSIFATITANKDAVTILKDVRENLQKLDTVISKTGKDVKSKDGINSIAKDYVKAIKEFQTLNTQKINGKNVANQQEEARSNLVKASKTYKEQLSSLSADDTKQVAKALTELKNVTIDARNSASDKDYINQIKQQYKIQTKLSQEQMQTVRETQKAYDDLSKSAQKYYDLVIKTKTTDSLPTDKKRLATLSKMYEDEANGIGIYANGTSEQKNALNSAIESARVNALRNYMSSTERYLEKNIYGNNRRYNENSDYWFNISKIRDALYGSDGNIGLKGILEDAQYLEQAFKDDTVEAKKLNEVISKIDTAFNIGGEIKDPITNTVKKYDGLKKQLETPYQYDLASPVDVENTKRRMSEFLARNPLAYQNNSTGETYKLRSDILGADVNKTTLKNLDEYKERLESLQKSVFTAGDFGSTLINNVDNFFQNHLLNFAGLFASFNITQKLAEAVNYSKELNAQLVELSKVSDTSIRTLNNQFTDFYNISKELGGSITDTITATADWARNGYSLPESKELAKVALLYKNVGDGIDIDTANSSLISTLRGFQLEASDALEIIDKFNEVANNFPIDTAGIGEALKRSAASFNAANTDLSQSIALVTATNSVIQNPEVVGTLWKTVSARIRGAKMELEELGEDTDGVVTSTSKLRADVKALTGFDIMKDENTFKSIYDIVVGIGTKWNEINDINQAALLEELAGKRSANALVAVLQNVDMLKEAYETAENSAGSAMEEQERYMEGMQYHFDQMTIAWQSFSHTLFESETAKGFADIATSVLDLFNNISKVVGLAPEVALVLGGIGLQFTQFTDSNGETIGRGLAGYISKIGDSLSEIRSRYGIKSVMNDPRAINDVGKLAAGQVKAFLSSWTGFLTIATAAYGVYSQASKYQDEMGNIAQQFGTQFKDSSETIEAYKERIDNLKNVISDSSSSFEEVTQARKDLMSIQNELINKFGEENNAINIITDSINNQTSALDKLQQVTFQTNWDKYVSEQNSIPKTIQRNLSYMLNPSKQFEVIRDSDAALGFRIQPIVIETAEDELIRTFEKYTDSSPKLGSILNRTKRNSKISEQANKILKDNNVELYGGQFFGNIYDVAKAYKELKNLINSNKNNFENPNDLITLNNELSTLSGNLNNVLNNYEDLNNGRILYNDILPDKQLTAQYDAINNAYDKYQKAVEDGNEKLQKLAINDFHKALTNAVDFNKDNPSLVNYFENLYSDLLDDVGTIQLKFDLQATNTKEISDDLRKSLIEQFKNNKLDKYTAESLNSFLNLNFDSVTENAEGQELLHRLADEYNISISQLVDTFTELGLVVTETQKQFIQMFGTDAWNQLSDREKANVSNQKNILNAARSAMLIDFRNKTGADYNQTIRDLSSVDVAVKNSAKNILDNYKPNMIDMAEIIGNMDTLNTVSSKIDAASQSVENYQNNLSSLTDVIKSQNSSESISISKFNKLKDTFNNVGESAGKLSEYYKLTEKGIELNVHKVRQLIKLNQEKSINKVNAAYKDLSKQYNQQYYELTQYQQALLRTANGEEEKRAILKRLISEKNADIKSTLEQKMSLDILYGQLQDMTQIYSEYIDALSSPNAGYQYDQIFASFSQIQDAVMEGKFGTDEVQKFIELMTGENVEYFSTDLIAKKYIEAQKIAQRYFTEDDSGLQNAQDDLEYQVDKSDSIVKDGNKLIIKDFDLLAANLKTSVDDIVIILNKMKEKGQDIEFNFEDIELQSVYKQLAELQAKQLRIGGVGIDVDLDAEIERLQKEINAYHTVLPVDVDFNVLVDQVYAIQDKVAKILEEYGLGRNDIDFDQFKDLDLSTSAEVKDKSGKPLNEELVKQIKQEYDKAQKILDDADNVLKITPDFSFNASGVGTSDEESKDGGTLAESISKEIQGAFNDADVNIPIQVDKEGNLNSFKNDFDTKKTELEKGITIPVKLDSNVNESLAKLKETATSTAPKKTEPGKDILNAAGVGRASGQNNLGSSPTLVGELGPEIHVDSSTGKQELLGQNGAEFVKSSNIKSNDIIFNAEQTKKILSGKSYANGTNKVGNVDINARPVVHNADGTYSTTSTTFQEKQIGNEENGHYRIGHFATIRSNGTRLTDSELNTYLDTVLGSSDPFATDAAMDNLLYKIDEKLSNGEQITDANLQQAFAEASAQDQDMHNLQDNMYRNKAYAKGLNNRDLVGELGPEIVVRDGKWGLVGQNGPVMGKNLVQPGDIVFNAKQTNDLLSNGQTNSLGDSYATGTKTQKARNTTASGEKQKDSSYISAAKSAAESQKNGKTSDDSSSSKSNTSATKSNTKAIEANTKAVDETKKEYEWIDRKLDLLNHVITMSNKTAENERFSNEKRIKAYEQTNTWLGAKLENLGKALDIYQNELQTALDKIPTQFAGYFNQDQLNMLHMQVLGGNVDKDYWKTEIKQTGTTDADKKVYEERTKLIDEIADLVNKVESTQEDMVDVNEEMADNIENIYNLRLAEQDAIISRVEAAASEIQSDMDIAVTKGRGIISADYYNDLIDNADDKIDALEDKLGILHEQLDDLEPDSEKYYSVLQEIYSIEQEISSCEAQQAEWNEAIKELPITHIKSYIENLQSITENLTNYTSILEAAGNSITASIIKRQTEMTSKIAEQYANQLKMLQDKMDTYKPGTDKWQEEFANIQEVENSIASIVQQMKEYEKQLLALPIEKLNKMNDYLSQIGDALNKIQDDNLTQINAAIETISRWEEEMVKPLQKQLDILQKQNEARQLQLSIEQAEYDLEKAKEEKTIQTVNSKGQLVYTANEEDIRNAQQSYEEARYNKIVKDIENQIDKIQKTADERTEKYEQIQKDTEYNHLINEAAELAGTTAANLVNAVNTGNDTNYYNTVKKSFEDTADKIYDNTEITEDLGTIISLLERLNESRVSGEISESQYNTLVNSVMSKAKNGTLTNQDVLSTLLNVGGYGSVGAVNSAVTDLLKTTTTELTNSSSETNVALKEIKAVYDKYYQSYEDTLKKISSLLDEANKAYENQKKAEGSASRRTSNSTRSSGGSSGGGGGSRVIAHGVDSVNHPNEGRTSSISRMSEGLLKGPVQSTNTSQELIQKLGIKPVDGDRVLTLLKPNELVANTAQQNQIISNIKNGLKSALGLASGVNMSHQAPQVNISMGDLSLPNVKDADGFAKALQNTFELNMNQYFSKVF